jgi:LacI family transcriptional regulator
LPLLVWSLQVFIEMDSKQPPTMRDIARRAAVSHATVSRALRDDPRITLAVRKRLQKLAARMGYRRDAKMAELMTHLRQGKSRAFQGTLAWITNLKATDSDQRGMMEQFHAAATARAEELGYRLDVFPGISHADAPKLGRIFYSRGIKGVWASLFWKVDYSLWNWDWRRFAFIHHGAEPKQRITDVVDAEDRENIQRLFDELSARGYRRIGVAALRHLEKEALFELTSGRLRFALRRPEYPYFEPCLVEALNSKGATQISRWIKRHDVDCVVSRWRGMTEILKTIGYRVPQDIGLAYVTVRPTSSEGIMSGINVNAPLIAATAIETLTSAVEQRRFGLPDVPRQTLVPGKWQQGTTCRQT